MRPRDQDVHLSKRLDVARLAAGDPAHPFRKQSELTAIARQHGQQAIGLAHVAPLEHDGRDPIKPLATIGFRVNH